MDPEKLLRGFLGHNVKKKKKKKKYKQSLMHGIGLGSGAKTALGMGALGVAFAAFEHFMSNKQPQQGYPQHGNPQQGYPQPGYQQPPQPQGWQQPNQPSTTPPPRPSMPTGPSTPPPPPPGTPTAPKSGGTSQQQQEAILLLRAMIASAYADGVLDANERNRIFEKLEEVGLTDEERHFISNELLNPPDISALAKQVHSPEMAQQVYAVSLLSIEIDTEEEKNFLRTLAQQLSLDENTVKLIHEELGIDPIA